MYRNRYKAIIKAITFVVSGLLAATVFYTAQAGGKNKNQSIYQKLISPKCLMVDIKTEKKLFKEEMLYDEDDRELIRKAHNIIQSIKRKRIFKDNKVWGLIVVSGMPLTKKQFWRKVAKAYTADNAEYLQLLNNKAPFIHAQLVTLTLILAMEARLEYHLSGDVPSMVLPCDVREQLKKARENKE